MNSHHLCVRRDRSIERRATTLIEVIGTMSVLLIFGVSAASILGAVTDLGHRTSRAQQTRQSIQRFAQVLRNDVRESTEVRSEQEDWPLVLMSGNTIVEYQWHQSRNELGRVVRKDETRLESDRFALTEKCRPELAMTERFVRVVLYQGRESWIVEARKP